MYFQALKKKKKIGTQFFYDIVQSSVLKAHETENLIRKWEMEHLTSKRNKTSLPTSAPLFCVAMKMRSFIHNAVIYY